MRERKRGERKKRRKNERDGERIRSSRLGIRIRYLLDDCTEIMNTQERRIYDTYKQTYQSH